jgi:hypothetical protein
VRTDLARVEELVTVTRQGLSSSLLSLLLVVGLTAVVLPSHRPPDEGSAALLHPLVEPTFRLMSGSGVEPAAADMETAAAAAVQLGTQVEVADLTTEFERHLVNPDGSVTFESHATAQRVRQGANWVPVDTTLQIVDGRVTPAAAVLDISLSTGGLDELVTLTDGERRLGLSWPSSLPPPELSGNTATYRDVLPGVDLLVRVDEDSFAQVLRVNNRDAAQQPALSRLAWDVTTADGLSLQVDADGAVDAVDVDNGDVVFTAPPSMMWDSAPPRDPALVEMERMLGEPLDAGEPEAGPGRVEVMPVEAAHGQLSVWPDLSMLSSTDTRFPVWIDPSFGRSMTNWSPVFKSRPNDSWPSGTSQPRDYIRAGNLNWANCGSWCGVWRSHIRFNVSSMAGETLIGNPTFRITLAHSASCGKTPVELWRTNSIGSGNVTWNGMKDKWLVDFGRKSAAANQGSCGPSPEVSMEWSNSTMKNSLQGRLDANTTYYAFGLRAPDESDPYQWKRFGRTSPRLIATYNRPPRTPDRLAVSGDCYQQCSSPAVIRTLRPTLEARVRDHHSASMDVTFQLRTESGTLIATGTDNSVNSGGTASWTPATLQQEQTYRFRVRAKNAHLNSEWSDYFYFTVDTNPPDAPTVESDLYQHRDTGTWNGGVGQAGGFTIDPNGSGDVIEYQYRWLDGSQTTVPVSKGQPATVSLTPPAELEQVLQVRSVDHAGNISPWRAYPFLVRPQPVDVAYWKFDEGQGSHAGPATGGSAYVGLLHGGASWAESGINQFDPEASGTAVALDGLSGFVQMPRTLATNHAAGWSVTAWVNPSSLDGDRTVVSQDGAVHNMFRLHYRASANGGDGGWCFTVRDADSLLATETSLCSPADQVHLGSWTHLAAAYDAPQNVIRLWVDGGPNNGEWPPGWSGEVAAPGAWAAGGAFSVGRARSGASGSHGEHWHGRIDEVRAHQVVLEEFEIQHTFLQCRYANCPEVEPPTEPVLVGEWRLDDGSGTNAGDSSGMNNDATLHGGASWGGDGYHGAPAVMLDGQSGEVLTDGPVLLTDQSFTVSAWARLDALPSSGANIVSQAGEYMSPFRLYYQGSSGRWRFLLRSVDEIGANTGSAVTGISGPTAEAGRWTHLVGVYDASTGGMSLYVDGQLANSGFHDIVWHADGPFAIGSILHTLTSDNGVPTRRDFFPGEIANVRAFQSALTPVQVGALFDEDHVAPEPFVDDFQRQVADGWGPGWDFASTWQSCGGDVTRFVDNAGIVTGPASFDDVCEWATYAVVDAMPATADVDMTLEMRAEGEFYYLGAVARWVDDENFYAFEVWSGAGHSDIDMDIWAMVDGEWHYLDWALVDIPYEDIRDVGVRMRVATVGDLLSVKVWTVGTPEPADWTVQTTDDRLSSGLVGVGGYAGASPGSVPAVWYGDLVAVPGDASAGVAGDLDPDMWSLSPADAVEPDRPAMDRADRIEARQGYRSGQGGEFR